MKFIYFTDMHGRANNPISRLDNFPETILKKLDWVMNLSNEYEAVLLFGGDWLNRPDTSSAFITEMGKIIKKAYGDIYTVLGNHDIYGYNPESFNRTPLNILRGVDFIKVLSEIEPIDIVEGRKMIRLTGSSSTFGIDKEDKKHYYPHIVNDDEYDNIHIHVTHGFLADHAWPNVECTVVKDILDTPADVILSGHEHSGFGIIHKNNKYFCNPGALARVTAGVGDVNMIVRVALLDTDKYGTDDFITFINCPIARPAEEVLDREKLLEEKEHEQKIQQFFSSVQEINIESTGTDIFEIFKVFAKQESLAEDVTNEVIKRLEVAAERIGFREESDEENC